MTNKETVFLHFRILPGIWRFNSGTWNAILKYDGKKQIIFQRLDYNSMETFEDNLIYLTPEKIKDLYHWLEARGAYDE